MCQFQDTVRIVIQRRWLFEAIGQMDQATQPNAALAEEMAAASGLKSQAQNLVQTVAVFKLPDGPHMGLVAKTKIPASDPRFDAPAPKPRTAPPKPRPRLRGGDDL